LDPDEKKYFFRIVAFRVDPDIFIRTAGLTGRERA
jgi:hypothetical protein